VHGILLPSAQDGGRLDRSTDSNGKSTVGEGDVRRLLPPISCTDGLDKVFDIEGKVQLLMDKPVPASVNLLEPTLPEFLANPYPFYHQLRSAAPVWWDELNQRWTLTRYTDVAALLRDPRLLTLSVDADPQYRNLGQVMNHWFLLQNPPDHTRLRGLVNKAFTPRIVDQLRPHIEQVTNTLLDHVQASGSMDLIADLAFPLPVTVIARMLGVPPEDHVQFHHWSRALASALEPTELLSPEVSRQSDAAIGNMADYFLRMSEAKRQQPGEDLLSALVALEVSATVLVPRRCIRR